jgi:branched-chain amino acid transport system permease protein
LPITLRQGSTGHRVYVAAGWLFVVAAVVYVPFAHEVGFAPGSIDKPFRINQLNDVIAFAVAILGLNLVIGFSGQLSLGQSAFVGLGAYTTVILVADHQWSYFATLPVAAGVCLVVGLLIGFPASRIRGQYLAIATLALAYVFPTLLLKYESLTGGPNGKGPARGEARLVPPSWAPFADAGRLAEPLWVYSILATMAAALFLLARNFVHSRPGRALLAVRDAEASAVSSGIDPTLYRAVAFAASAVYGGLAGAMLMMNRPFASDAQFGTRVAIFLVVGLVVGGAGTISGAIPGAFVYFFVPYYVSEWTYDQSGMPPGLRQLASPLFEWLRPVGGGLSGIVFGLTLLLLVFVMPGGCVAGLRALRARVVRIVPHPRWLDDVGRAADPPPPGGPEDPIQL